MQSISASIDASLPEKTAIWQARFRFGSPRRPAIGLDMALEFLQSSAAYENENSPIKTFEEPLTLPARFTDHFMLLNEFLKARRQIDSQQKQIEALTAGLQEVSAQFELSKTAPQVVNNF